MGKIIAIPFALLLVLFALSNRAPVSLALWPTDFAWQVPLSLAVLAGMAVAFLLGALFTWAGVLGQRRRARRAEDHVRVLEAQVSDLKARVPVARLPLADA